MVPTKNISCHSTLFGGSVIMYAKLPCKVTTNKELGTVQTTAIADGRS